ncbi:unnamed protein product, partial [Symbiodinium pilosum]
VMMARCLPVVSVAPEVSTQLPTMTPPTPAQNEDLISFDMVTEDKGAAEQVNMPQNTGHAQ